MIVFVLFVLKKWGPEYVVRKRVFPGKDEIRVERKEVSLWQGSENSLALEQKIFSLETEAKWEGVGRMICD